jgi:hypothetical protein
LILSKVAVLDSHEVEDPEWSNLYCHSRTGRLLKLGQAYIDTQEKFGMASRVIRKFSVTIRQETLLPIAEVLGQGRLLMPEAVEDVRNAAVENSVLASRKLANDIMARQTISSRRERDWDMNSKARMPYTYNNLDKTNCYRQPNGLALMVCQQGRSGEIDSAGGVLFSVMSGFFLQNGSRGTWLQSGLSPVEKN